MTSDHVGLLGGPVLALLIALLLARFLGAPVRFPADITSVSIIGFAKSEVVRLYVTSQALKLLVLLVGFASVYAPTIQLSSRPSEVVAFVTSDLLSGRDDWRTLGHAVARLHKNAPSARIGLIVGDSGGQVQWLSSDEASQPERLIQRLAGIATTGFRPNLEVVVDKALSSMSAWGVNRFLLILSGGNVEGGDFGRVTALARQVQLTVVAAQIGPGPHGNALRDYWILGGLMERGRVESAFAYMTSRVEQHKADLTHHLTLCAFVVLVATFVIEHTSGSFEATEIIGLLRARFLAMKLRSFL